MTVLNKNHDLRKMNPLEKFLSWEQRHRGAYKGIGLHFLIGDEVQKLEDHSNILQQPGIDLESMTSTLLLGASLIPKALGHS